MITLEFSRQDWMPISWIIRAGTWSPWSHVDLVMPDGSLLGARAGDGVQVRSKSPASHAQRYSVDVSHAVAYAVIKKAESQVGKPYDWTGIAGFIVRRNWQKDDAWFCSELVAWAFAEAGRPLVNAEHHHISPRDLTLSPFLCKEKASA